jgi:probable HAF family extracellular repeat protein
MLRRRRLHPTANEIEPAAQQSKKGSVQLFMSQFQISEVSHEIYVNYRSDSSCDGPPPAAITVHSQTNKVHIAKRVRSSRQCSAGQQQGGNMRFMFTRATALVVLATLATAPGLAAQNQRAPNTKQIHYAVRDLGTLGGTAGVAEGISDRGWVVGSANLPGDQNGHAFLWRDGVMTDLGTLGGQNSQEQWPVKDNRGLIVGSAETSTRDPFNEDFCGFDSNAGFPPTGLICLGFLWQDGSPPQVLDIQAVVWGPHPGEIHTLAPLPADTSAWAIGTNDHEQIIGVSGKCVSPNFNAPGATTPEHAVIWHHGTVTNIGTLGGTFVFPWAINSKGQVVGQSSPTGDTSIDAFLWQDGVMTDLGVVPGDFGSLAFSMNDGGQVVGGSCTQSFNCRAFLWQDGVMIDLNTLVIGSTSLHLVFGNDINSRGEIAAYVFDQSNGEFHAALAIPCDEEHASTDDCADNTGATTAGLMGNSERPAVVLPDNVREQLRMRLGFGQFGSGPTRLQQPN